MHSQKMIPCGVGLQSLICPFAIFADPALAGIAYTIDPEYEAEVREYLGWCLSPYHLVTE